MEIKTLTASVDQKLRQLDQQLVEFNRALSDASAEDQAKLNADIEALQKIRIKLVKSRDLALEAHQLERATNEQLRRRQKYIGLALCLFSLAGLVWLGVLIYAELFTSS